MTGTLLLLFGLAVMWAGAHAYSRRHKWMMQSELVAQMKARGIGVRRVE